MAVKGLKRVNILDKGFLADPFPLSKQLRKAFPVCIAEPGNAWTIWRYEDVKDCLRNTSVFSSSGFQAMYQPEWLAPDCRRDPFILSMDGDLHEKNRNLVNKAFLKKIIDRYEPLMRDTASRLTKEITSETPVDFIASFAFPYTAATLSAIVGVGGQSISDLRHWLELLECLSPIPPEPAQINLVEAAIRKQNAIFDQLILCRRDRPEGDLLSALAGAEIDGKRLGDVALRSCLDLLITAGLGTTIYSLTNAILFLSRRRDIWREIRQDASLIPLFIEEMLRFDPATHVLLRKTTCPAVVAEIEIPECSLVCLMIGSANRDESVFADPEQFNMFRKGEAPSIAFGFGAHACVGLALAKLEMKVALEVITCQFKSLSCPPDQELQWISSITTHGLSQLPVSFRTYE